MTTLFYQAFIEPILSFSLVSWFGNLPLKNRNSLNQIIKWDGKRIGESQLNRSVLYSSQLHCKVSSVFR